MTGSGARKAPCPCCCDTCHWRIKCADPSGCCSCIPKRLCVTINGPGGDSCTEDCNCLQTFTILEWDCDANHYQDTIGCGPISETLTISFHREYDTCYLKLVADCFGWTDENPYLVEMYIPAIGQEDNALGPTCQDIYHSISGIVVTNDCGTDAADCSPISLTIENADDVIVDKGCGSDCIGEDCICRCYCVRFGGDSEASCTEWETSGEACFDEYSGTWEIELDDDAGNPHTFTFSIGSDDYGNCVLNASSSEDGELGDISFGLDGGGIQWESGGENYFLSLTCISGCTTCDTDDSDCPGCCGNWGSANCNGANFPDLEASLTAGGCTDTTETLLWSITNPLSCSNNLGDCQHWCANFQMPDCSVFLLLELGCDASEGCDGTKNYFMRMDAQSTDCDPSVQTTKLVAIEVQCEPFYLKFQTPPIVNAPSQTGCDCCADGYTIEITEP